MSAQSAALAELTQLLGTPALPERFTRDYGTDPVVLLRKLREMGPLTAALRYGLPDLFEQHYNENLPFNFFEAMIGGDDDLIFRLFHEHPEKCMTQLENIETYVIPPKVLLWDGSTVEFVFALIEKSPYNLSVHNQLRLATIGACTSDDILVIEDVDADLSDEDNMLVIINRALAGGYLFFTGSVSVLLFPEEQEVFNITPDNTLLDLAVRKVKLYSIEYMLLAALYNANDCMWAIESRLRDLEISEDEQYNGLKYMISWVRQMQKKDFPAAVPTLSIREVISNVTRYLKPAVMDRFWLDSRFQTTPIVILVPIATGTLSVTYLSTVMLILHMLAQIKDPAIAPLMMVIVGQNSLMNRRYQIYLSYVFRDIVITDYPRPIQFYLLWVRYHLIARTPISHPVTIMRILEPSTEATDKIRLVYTGQGSGQLVGVGVSLDQSSYPPTTYIVNTGSTDAELVSKIVRQ